MMEYHQASNVKEYVKPIANISNKSSNWQVVFPQEIFESHGVARSIFESEIKAKLVKKDQNNEDFYKSLEIKKNIEN